MIGFQQSAFQNNAYQSGVAGGGTSSGAGTAGLATGEVSRRRDPRLRTGLLPLARRSVVPRTAPKKPLLPPIFDAPLVEPASKAPLPFIAPGTVYRFDNIARQIIEAEGAHRTSLKQDDQDAADIADVLALLD